MLPLGLGPCGIAEVSDGRREKPPPIYRVSLSLYIFILERDRGTTYYEFNFHSGGGGNKLNWHDEERDRSSSRR